ncbi:MAG: sugar phosphate isomerase/epimerase [Caldilineaceae bacterium]|nr:sugar phosphate isomerase/epimerase [Caldilineaceae bacterium]
MEHTGLIPLRLGATSYVIPGDLVDNARHLAGRVADMQLILFDLPGGSSNLPTSAQIDELAAIGRQGGLSYTVHLPADLPVQSADALLHPVLRKARDLVHSTLPLEPHAYIFHLDGMAVRSPATPRADLHRWQEDALYTLELMRGWVDDGQRLALENVEGYALDFFDALIAAPVARCVDVGHLWLDGHDPLPYVQRWLERTRVIHLHGVMEHDHRSLIHTPPQQLDPLVELLLRCQFNGVATLEVFEDDFGTSFEAIRASIERCGKRLRD